MRVVYYIHHHGSGHLRHARRLQSLQVAEVISVGAPGADIELPPDVDPTHPHIEPADSPFHWTPSTPLLRRRMSALHQVLLDTRPDVVLVDVSVEAAVFSHLAGWPVAHRRMPGLREDAPHQLAYAISKALFAYYPHRVEQPDYGWTDKTQWLGMLAHVSTPAASTPVPSTIIVLSGAGGDGVPLDELARAARQTRGHHWHVLGPSGAGQPPAGLPDNLHLHGWLPSTEQWLAQAELVVCGAGHNTIADVAAAHRPCIIVPEPRPHAEQAQFADSLHRVAGIPVADSWADADWPALLEAPRHPDALADTLLVSQRTFRSNVSHLLEAVTESS